MGSPVSSMPAAVDGQGGAGHIRVVQQIAQAAVNHLGAGLDAQHVFFRPVRQRIELRHGVRRIVFLHVPYNALHDQGYPSIGCEPCTRAVQPGEDVRAGRWWWENPDSKECGLHMVDGKLALV